MPASASIRMPERVYSSSSLSLSRACEDLIIDKVVLEALTSGEWRQGDSSLAARGEGHLGRSRSCSELLLVVRRISRRSTSSNKDLRALDARSRCWSVFGWEMERSRK